MNLNLCNDAAHHARLRKTGRASSAAFIENTENKQTANAGGHRSKTGTFSSVRAPKRARRGVGGGKQEEEEEEEEACGAARSACGESTDTEQSE